MVGRFDFLDSWFEEGAAVEQLLEGKRMARAKRVALVRDSLLPEHAAKLGATALLGPHCCCAIVRMRSPGRSSS